LERYHITRSKLGFDSCIAVSATYNASRVLLNRQTLYPALYRVVLDHPALSVQVDMSGPKPNAKLRFVQLAALLLDDIVSFVEERDNTNSIAQVLADQLSRGLEFGTHAPLWRLVIVSGRTVVFACHHAVADGLSGLAFHSALLSALNAPPDAPAFTGNEISIPGSSQLVPPIESLTSVSVSFGSFCSAVFNTFVPPSLTNSASAWTGNPVVQTPSVTTHVRCWEIEASQTANLLTLCRKNATTLTACLHTLAVGVLARLISSNQKLRSQRFKSISTSIAVSLRPYTGASPNVMCDHISGISSYTPISALANESTSRAWFSWPVAAKLNKKIRASTKKSREVVGTIRYLFLLGMSESFFLGQLGQKRKVALELSNVGKFTVPATESNNNEDAWSIGNMYFAQCDSVSGPAIKFNVVGSPTGSVNITFTWGPGAIDDDFAEAFVRDIKAALSSVLETSLLS
jgi:hypothetical protein